MRLIPIDSIVIDEDIDLDTFISLSGEILRKGGVDRSVVVDHNLRVVDEKPLAITLKKLGVKYIPVSEDYSENTFVSLESLGFFDDVKPSVMRVFRDTEELLYRNWPTPLVMLKSLSTKDIRVWAKLEGFNPYSMSVKDRIGWYMYRKAIDRNGSRPLKLLVESTSTNTGLAIAAMCAIHGSKLRAYIPSTVSKTGELLLKIFGVDVIRSQKALTVELIDDVDKIAREENAVHLNQFHNDANFEVHLRYTAKELELQIREAGIRLRGIVGGLGTSGHMSAISHYFKNRFSNVKIYGVVPKEGTSIQGIRRVESGMKWIHKVVFDRIVDVDPDDAAKTVIDIARREGILIGLSSGAVAYGFKTLLIEGYIDEGDYILIFPDHGFKYVEQLQRYI
ncbi:cysteine synthase [Ignisphaera aggregans DSM 17230]|uniref:Cysteine synthase n=1 Tax=Ignisphaera aggregans (strain DSM 17230 / JCM 13409 / AQ1.S1) TaxID=583356 RepID=E0SSJ5_IGNAA|nr:cysteine synthase [Ignisphaera aggregans DSM 17230]